MLPIPHFPPPDQPVEVIYEAWSPVTLHQALVVLSRHGFTPYVLDNPEPPRKATTHRVRVAVPPEQAKAAYDLLAAWERENEKDVEVYAREFKTQFAFPFITAFLTLCVLGFFVSFGVAYAGAVGAGLLVYVSLNYWLSRK